MRATIEHDTITRRIVTSASDRIAAVLLDLGYAAAAERVLRCARARQGRAHGPGWPWRCRAAGCPLCLPRSVARWGEGIAAWASEAGGLDRRVSSASLPVSADDPLGAVAHLRRAFRDLRDRAARTDGRWASVAAAGLLHGAEARLAVVHTNLPAWVVEARLRCRWPALAWIPGNAPDLRTPPLDETLLVALARRQRGAEPLRIVVAAQRAACESAPPAQPPDPWAAPMPLTFWVWRRSPPRPAE